MQSTDSIETYAYRTNEDLVNCKGNNKIMQKLLALIILQKKI